MRTTSRALGRPAPKLKSGGLFVQQMLPNTRLPKFSARKLHCKLHCLGVMRAEEMSADSTRSARYIESALSRYAEMSESQIERTSNGPIAPGNMARRFGSRRAKRLADIPPADFDRLPARDPAQSESLRQLKTAWHRATPGARAALLEWIG